MRPRRTRPEPSRAEVASARSESGRAGAEPSAAAAGTAQPPEVRGASRVPSTLTEGRAPRTGGEGPRFPDPPPEEMSRGSRLALMALVVRQQGKESGLLDRGRELSLMPGINATQPARQNLAGIGDEAGEKALVLVIDVTNARLENRGWFLSASGHGYSSSSSSSFSA